MNELAFIFAVESSHFRTVEDTGANPNAMLIWNIVRQRVGLPRISKDDLPAWDGRTYAMPANSFLTTNPTFYAMQQKIALTK